MFCSAGVFKSDYVRKTAREALFKYTMRAELGQKPKKPEKARPGCHSLKGTRGVVKSSTGGCEGGKQRRTEGRRIKLGRLSYVMTF